MPSTNLGYVGLVDQVTSSWMQIGRLPSPQRLDCANALEYQRHGRIVHRRRTLRRLIRVLEVKKLVASEAADLAHDSGRVWAYPGKHKPLIDRATWDRVQALLGGHAYQSHEMTYSIDLIQCGHCGHPITGERKTNQTKSGERTYVYYRCTYYNMPGHPRTRVTEAQIDDQLVVLFDRMRIEDEGVREWFREVLRAQTHDAQEESRAQRSELLRQETLFVGQQDRLLNMRIDDQIYQEVFAAKQTELRDRLSKIKLQLDVLDRSHDETANLAVKVFELSQTLRQQWISADCASKRRILEIVFLNCRLDDTTLVPTIRKPFDVLAEGLVSSNSRGDWI